MTLLSPLLSTPLLGALLLTEGLLSQSQLESCLLLQQHDYPELRLGEIAVRCGYLSAGDLVRTIQLQQDCRRILQIALESQMPMLADLDILIITARPSAALSIALTGMGATVQYADRPPSADATPADLILLDPAQLSCYEALPEASLVALLPPEVWRWRDLHRAPAGMLALLERAVRQARERRTTTLRARSSMPAAYSASMLS
jgi:hypothetical protein